MGAMRTLACRQDNVIELAALLAYSHVLLDSVRENFSVPPIFGCLHRIVS